MHYFNPIYVLRGCGWDLNHAGLHGLDVVLQEQYP